MGKKEEIYMNFSVIFSSILCTSDLELVVVVLIKNQKPDKLCRRSKLY